MKRSRLYYPLFFLVAILVFAYSLQLRKGYIGGLSLWHHQYLTGSTLKFTGNWYHEGFWKLRGAMVENPVSVEFGDIKSRHIYSSYGIGSQLPVFIIAKISGKEPSVLMIQIWNLCNQFLIALLLGLVIYKTFKKYNVYIAQILSIVPLVVYVFLPHTMYWHLSVYFSDQAIILWVVLVLFLEVYRDENKKNYFLDITQAFFIFYGIFTDWLMVFVALYLWLYRVIVYQKTKQNFRHSFLQIGIPSVLGVLLTLSHIAWLGGLQALLERGKLRVSDQLPEFGKHNNFADTYWGDYLGWLDSSIIFISMGIVFLIFFLLNTKRPSELNIIMLPVVLLFAFVTHTLVLKNHATVHEFSALKWQLILALVPFAWVPAMLMVLKKGPKWQWGFMGLCMVLVSAFLYEKSAKILSKFEKPELYAMEISKYLKSNAQYLDLYFSPDFEIPENPPQQLGISRKRVYKARNMAEINQFVMTNCPNKNAQLHLIYYDDGDGCDVNTKHPFYGRRKELSKHVSMVKLETSDYADSSILQLNFCK